MFLLSFLLLLFAMTADSDVNMVTLHTNSLWLIHTACDIY